MHASSLVVAIAPEVGWKMISQINNLSHILHLVSKALRTSSVIY